MLYIIYTKTDCIFCHQTEDLLKTLGQDKTKDGVQNVFFVCIDGRKAYEFLSDDFAKNLVHSFSSSISLEGITFKTVPQIFHIPNSLVDINDFLNANDEKVHEKILQLSSYLRYIGPYTNLLKVVDKIRAEDIEIEK